MRCVREIINTMPLAKAEKLFTCEYSLVFFIILHTRACVCVVGRRFPMTPVEGGNGPECVSKLHHFTLPLKNRSEKKKKKQKKKKCVSLGVILRHARARVLE